MAASYARLLEKLGFDDLMDFLDREFQMSRMLGLSERVKDEKMSIEPPVMEKAEEVIALKPELKRRVGQRKPKRNDVP